MSQRQDLAVDDNHGLIETGPTSVEERMQALITGDAAPPPPPPDETPPPEPPPTPVVEVVEEEAAPPAPESEHPASDQPPADEIPDATDRFTVRVDGEPVEVELDELLKGYSRTADYTRKTQRLAQDRLEFDSDAVAVRSERERYGALLGQLEEAITANTPQEPDWATLRAKDPAEFAAQFAEHQARKDQVRQVQEERARAQQTQATEQQAAIQTQLHAEQERLIEAIPAWKDAESATKERSDLLAYGQTVGFTKDELDGVVDHRAVVMLRKAMLYDKLQAKKPAAQKKAQRSPVVKPGASKGEKKPPAPGQVARDRLKQSGSVKDATAVFLERMQAGG